MPDILIMFTVLHGRENRKAKGFAQSRKPYTGRDKAVQDPGQHQWLPTALVVGRYWGPESIKAKGKVFCTPQVAWSSALVSEKSW